MVFSKTSDGSYIDAQGKVVFFSIEKFVEDICIGRNCFICGDSSSQVEFNDEHILPDWILRRYNLFSEFITLPNLTQFRYDQYKIPCCKRCNSLMGDLYEKPIGELISEGHKAVGEYVRKNGAWLFFSWLALIFLKTHLKDKHLRLHQDRRKNNEKISDNYTWEEFHHIHCIARSFFSGCTIDYRVQGSFAILPARCDEPWVQFDYMDFSPSRTVLLRMGDVALLTGLTDSCAAITACQNIFDKIKGPLSRLQLRELMAHFAFVQLALKEGPEFYSDIKPYLGINTMLADVPKMIELPEYNKEDFGAVFYNCCRDILAKWIHPDKERIQAAVIKGECSFLFDDDGNFIENPTEEIP